MDVSDPFTGSTLASDRRCRRWHVSQRRGPALRGRHLHGHPVGARMAYHRQSRGQAERRRPALTPRRSLSRASAVDGRGPEGHHSRRTRGHARARPRCGVRTQHDLAVPRPPRHDLQKKQRTPASRNDPTSPSAGRLGSTRSLTLIQSGWSSSMRRERRRRWLGCGAEHCAGNVAALRCRTAIGSPPPSLVRSGCLA